MDKHNVPPVLRHKPSWAVGRWREPVQVRQEYLCFMAPTRREDGEGGSPCPQLSPPVRQPPLPSLFWCWLHGTCLLRASPPPCRAPWDTGDFRGHWASVDLASSPGPRPNLLCGPGQVPAYVGPDFLTHRTREWGRTTSPSLLASFQGAPRCHFLPLTTLCSLLCFFLSQFYPKRRT